VITDLLIANGLIETVWIGASEGSKLLPIAKVSPGSDTISGSATGSGGDAVGTIESTLNAADGTAVSALAEGIDGAWSVDDACGADGRASGEGTAVGEGAAAVSSTASCGLGGSAANNCCAAPGVRTAIDCCSAAAWTEISVGRRVDHMGKCLARPTAAMTMPSARMGASRRMRRRLRDA